MAYDPNDPADKKIVDKLIQDALAAQAEEHEAEVEGLKSKRNELIQKLKKAREGKEDDGDSEKLSAEVERLSGELKKVTKDLQTKTKDLETVTGERDGLSKNMTSLLVDQGLTSALTEAKVPTQFLPAVKALLSPKVTIKTEGEDRKAVVGDKALGDFVKEWSQGDEGKAYIAAPVNGGGGSLNPQGGGNQSGKIMTRSAYEAADLASRAAFFAEGGRLTDDAA